MAMITKKHFGANIVLTNDSAKPNSPFVRMTQDLEFSEFRYPGGSVTELATWGGAWGLASMEDIFSREPMTPGEPGYVMTMREAFKLAGDQGAKISLVTPTKQFYNADTGVYDYQGFNRYLDELGTVLKEYPRVEVASVEIGNEFWGKHAQIGSRSWTAEEYGTVANIQLPRIAALMDEVAAANGSRWPEPNIGIQAGTAWRANASEESRDIIDQISIANRGHVDTIFQHIYPNISKNNMQWQTDWGVDAMKVFEGAPGFKPELELTLSEFNVSGMNQDDPNNKPNQFGNRLAGEWIEEFARVADAGVDTVHHWGLQYKWLRNKMYDKDEFPTDHANYPGNTPLDQIPIAVTPIGMVYDLAQQHVMNKETMTDTAAIAGLSGTQGMGITGFENENQRVVFLRNASDESRSVTLGAQHANAHVTAYILNPADNPATPGWDESTQAADDNPLANSRADLTIKSGRLDKIEIPAEGILVVTITAPGIGVDIFGSDQKTDHRTSDTNDLIVGGTGKDLLYGGVGNDVIEGGPGDAKDVLHGGAGNDTLRGGGGDDVLISSEGNDTIATGEGEDLIIVNGNQGTARINLSGGQNILLTSGARNTIVNGFTEGDELGVNGVFKTQTAFMAATSRENGNTRITLPNGNTILLVGYAQPSEELVSNTLDFYTKDDAEVFVAERLTGLRDVQAEYALDALQGVNTLATGTQYAPDINAIPLYETMPDGQEVPIGDWDLGGEGGGETPPVQPEPTRPPQTGDEDDGDEETPQDNDSGGGGGCFVATAAYGHRMHPEVVALRRFRDHHLVKTMLGRAFIRTYWVIGPRMATRVGPQTPSGRAVRAISGALVRTLRRASLTQGK